MLAVWFKDIFYSAMNTEYFHVYRLFITHFIWEQEHFFVFLTQPAPGHSIHAIQRITPLFHSLLCIHSK